SVILAGVLLKLGTYGIYRFSLPFAPAAIVEYAPVIATLSIIGIIYAGLICWVQRDVKKLVAYSSVSHLGFCVLGLVAVNSVGVTGSVLYMINHGLSTGALFLLIGMIYERYHTRDMEAIGGLAKKMPVWATFMVFFTMASVGLPGLNGFVSEIMCLMGAFQADTAWAQSGVAPGATFGNVGPWYAAVAGTGMIIAAMYLLYMVGKVCFGPLKEPPGHDDNDAGHGPKLSADLNVREILVLSPLAIACLVFGLYPKPLIDGLEAPVNQTVALVQAGAERVLTGPDETDQATELATERTDDAGLDAGDVQ
ncbi:MAG: NADH-quinone oxidoreductase subunit M, partial [Planctomycetota bacterium]